MPEKSKLDQKLAKRLAEIGLMEPTIDLTKRESFVEEAGWHLDSREAALPSEPPGPPQADGPFATACEIVQAYTFPPSNLIAAASILLRRWRTGPCSSPRAISG